MSYIIGYFLGVICSYLSFSLMFNLKKSRLAQDKVMKERCEANLRVCRLKSNTRKLLESYYYKAKSSNLDGSQLAMETLSKIIDDFKEL